MNHSKLKWPEANPKVTYACTVCNSVIEGEDSYDVDNNGNVYVRCYTPASRYWNVEKVEIYCNASHSLEAHLRK